MVLWGFARQYIWPVVLAVSGGALWVLDMIGRYEEILGLPSWVWGASAGALILAAMLVFFYQVHTRLEAAGKARADTDEDENDGLQAAMDRLDDVMDPPTYEGTHETLMNFVVGHIFPVCDARNRVHGEIIGALCPNGPVRELAQYGASRYEGANQLQGGMSVLDGLSDSPPKFIPFEEMCFAVGHIEYGYDAYLSEGNRIARSGYVHPRVGARVAELWEQWRIAHNAMVAAYEPIKRNSKMGRLFRPVREGMWGGQIPPSTNGIPIPLMIREPEVK